jgi:hypothetical protein
MTSIKAGNEKDHDLFIAQITPFFFVLDKLN